MSKKLFVANLPYSATSSDLEQFLGERGGSCERAEMVFDRATGRSRGFAFVHFATDEDAASAMDRLRGSEMGGRELVVNEATSDGGRPARREGRRDSRGREGRSQMRGARSHDRDEW
jgi:cold-inducible RNA-binding protein